MRNDCGCAVTSGDGPNTKFCGPLLNVNCPLRSRTNDGDKIITGGVVGAAVAMDDGNC
jgi:hypothetical protein